MPNYKPEIFALGIRNAMAIIVHPETGEIWENENGPQGGDEINIIKRGVNYGWPVISYGRAYTGELDGGSGPSSGKPFGDGLEQPWLFWAPAIGLSGMTFYTGDRFPEWKGSLFVGAMVGEQLLRIVLEPEWVPDSSRLAADRAQAAYSRGAARARWPPLSADGRGGWGAAAARAGERGALIQPDRTAPPSHRTELASASVCAARGDSG